MLQDIKIIYNHMGDEISEACFMERLNFSISRDRRYIERLIDLTVRNCYEWKNFREALWKLKNTDVVLFGSGIWGDTLLSEFKGFPWKCIIDNASKGANKENIPIIMASEFLKSYKDEKVVISSYKNKDAMKEQCIRAGVPMDNIIDAGNVIYALTEGKIYFDEEIPIKPKSGVFIDGGCFDGSDSRRYVDQFHGNVICFEPDEKNIGRIAEKLYGYEKNYRIIPKALWRGENKLSFSADGNYGSHIEEGNSGCTIFATSIDAVVEKTGVAMIKMDIEGAELEALQGAENTIKRDHPILAISVYHKPADILAVPEYILSVFEGYKLYLRHYSFSWYDTVLYAIPEELS